MAGRKPGTPKTGGRKKGTPNKTTALLKDAIIEAARQAGNELDEGSKDGLISYLRVQAKETPTAFMPLLGKVLPMQVTGPPDANGNPTGLTVTFIKPDDAD